MSSGLITLVSAGSTTLTITRPGGHSTTDTITATSASGSVTSASVYYTSSLPSALGGSKTTQMLMRTGSTYQLTAKDQSGNVLGSGVGTWTSSDATHAPISSSGLVSPSGMTGARFTYTHTASGVTAICDATVLPATTAAVTEAVTYANDVAFRNAIRNSVTTGYATPAPTGGTGALYQDGLNEGYITLDSTRPFMDNQSVKTFFANGTAATISLRGRFPSALPRLQLIVVHRYEPGWNSGQLTGGSAGSYKELFLNQNGPQGRYDIQYSNGDLTTASAYSQLLVQNGGSGVGGCDDRTVQTSTETATQWGVSSGVGDWYLTIIQYEARLNDSEMWSRQVRVRLGEDPRSVNRFQTVGPVTGKTILSGAMQSGYSAFHMDTISPFGENMNNAVNHDMFRNVGLWEVVDGTVYADPYGIGNDSSSPTISSISGNALAIGGTNQVITINGTNFNEHCYPVFSNSAVKAHYSALGTSAITVVSSTQITVAVDIAVGTAADPSGTVTITNATSGHTSGTAAVTIS